MMMFIICSVDYNGLALAIEEGLMRQWLAEIGKQLSALRRVDRFAVEVRELLRQELELSNAIFEVSNIINNTNNW